MATTSNRYTFTIAVRSDAYPGSEACAAEVTAHFADNVTEPQTLALHKDAQASASLEHFVYSASLLADLPKSVLHADFSINGAKIDPAALPEGIVSVSTNVDQVQSPEDTQALPADKNVCKIDSAVSSCADLLLADIQNVHSSEQSVPAQANAPSGLSADAADESTIEA
ncbi:hypothetical protein GGF40_004217, partial [Coemansia sp. RSA 1286]